ncbi:hypothetical protein P43SY_004375 [Pythium insidiosum]|uniref:HTH psq-type domain-containing protein n=1 Tax=Pythium insidiosum TaxID=114742 RepID=A0AAD5Q6I2_PYTIN|nr:hypothetical protein P43SY_004375 [Pythium insidiosum]
MPRASSVSEKVWAQAIHAVTVQKMSLRRAAQLYGVHHMSLHRRVRGRYMTTAASRFEDDFALTAAEEEEVVSVLREQFLHECFVSADDVRYVVRTIASQDGRRDIPSDFPVNRWISNFKRVHGFTTPGAKSPTAQQSSGAAAVTAATGRSTASDASARAPAQRDPSQRTAGSGDAGYPAAFSPRLPDMSRLSCSSASNSPFHGAPGAASGASSYTSNNSSSSTTSSSKSNSNNGSNGFHDQRDSTSESESEHHRESHEREERLAGDKRCRQSNVVSPETWEKAMDAVEIHGMSLRNAAKAYGVHFAALHRRVKKRALKKEQSPPLENYIPFEDEAGIVRVIHARADLGILMTWEELVDLLNRTALKYAMITPESSRAIVRRFQSRVEQSIRHLIKDWPLPHFDSLYRFQLVAGERMSPPPMPVQLPALYPLQPPQYVLASADPKPSFSMGNLSPLPPPPPPSSSTSSSSQSMAQRSEQLRRQLGDDRSARLQM